jgi:UDP-N-acetylmuramyl tripeptide synthase
VIAGKGHEQGQLVAGQVIPFDDVKVAQEILIQLKGVVR